MGVSNQYFSETKAIIGGLPNEQAREVPIVTK